MTFAATPAGRIERWVGSATAAQFKRLRNTGGDFVVHGRGQGA